MAAVKQRRLLLACYLLLREILRRRRRENIKESMGFGYGICSKTEFLANHFPSVFSGSYNTPKLCYKDIRVACRHFEACIWT